MAFWGKVGEMSSYSKANEGTLGLAGLLEATLTGKLRRCPAGRLMQRIIREHPGASMNEVMQLFRDAAIDDPAVFEDILAHALRRDPFKPQEEPKRRRSG